MTCMFEQVVILQGEIRCLSLLGFKGLKKPLKVRNFCLGGVTVPLYFTAFSNKQVGLIQLMPGKTRRWVQRTCVLNGNFWITAQLLMNSTSFVLSLMYKSQKTVCMIKYGFTWKFCLLTLFQKKTGSKKLH